MDPALPDIEADISRRRRRRLFNHSRIPVRMLVPNFFTLLGLCAGLTSIRMSIEGRWDLALAAIVFAALLDGIDGRVARLLKASSRFGAELDSLADFVNFGVAPAVLIFTWGLGDAKSIGWICVMIFALASALRLARFNVAVDEEKPRWQSNFFIGMPTPAAAIVVLLPFYLATLGLDPRGARFPMTLVLIYTVVIAAMMVSTIPTYSGKLLGERIRREWVLPLFVLAIGLVACLVTYPYETLTIASLGYLALIPLSWKRFLAKEQQSGEAGAAPQPSQPMSAGGSVTAAVAGPAGDEGSPKSGADASRIVDFRQADGGR
jgi:CDP-diacylglycerol--serine O-phosphatidyltransferase